MDMAQTGPCQSIYAFNDRPLNWMIRHVAEGDLSPAAKTVAYKVTQNPDSKFPLTMLTQTRLWSPSFGEQPLYHNHSCVDAEDEGQEVVVAHIQLGFYMPMNISFYWSSSIRPLTLHADERPARQARKLPIHGEEEDLEDAREILSWGVTQCEATAAFGGIVPIVKDGMRDMARQAIEAYGGMAHLGIQESSKWRDYQCEFEEAVRPLDEEMVVRALANAMAQVREACRQYELTKGGKVAGTQKRA
ncbi:hypothetical protein PG993_008420 [Apiospora rasikravindrae]|uniref:Uncharacterized protein n=1 Tax=Apiospora rasikravindrae TaxID=990691 RepID=A0ABR1T267_9PEZI